MRVERCITIVQTSCDKERDVERWSSTEKENIDGWWKNSEVSLKKEMKVEMYIIIVQASCDKKRDMERWSSTEKENIDGWWNNSEVSFKKEMRMGRRFSEKNKKLILVLDMVASSISIKMLILCEQSNE